MVERNPGGLASAAARHRPADSPPLRPGARHRVAADLLLRPDRGRPRQRAGRRRGGQRARAGQGERRARRRRSSPTDCSRPRRRTPDLVLPSPMAELPTGAEFGVAVHAVLEAVDPQASDLTAELRRAGQAVLARLPAGTFTADQLAEGLAPAFATPLGPLAGDRTLADIPRRDRLAELGFELPLAGGEVTRAELLLADLVPAAPRASAARRRTRRLPRRAGRPGAGRPDAPRLPHRQHRRRAPGAGARRRAALPGRRLQDELARPAGRPTADRRAVHAGADGRGDDPRPLPPAGPALRGRGAPAAALAPAGVRPGPSPGRGALPVRPRDGRAGHPGRRPGALWRVQLAAAGRPGGRAVRPAGRGPAHDGHGHRGPRRRRAWPAGARPAGTVGNVQRGRGPGRRGRAHRARGRPDRAARTTTGCCWPWPSPSAPCATGRSRWTCRPWTRRCSTRPRRVSTCRAALAGADGVGGGVSGEPSGHRRRRGSGRASPPDDRGPALPGAVLAAGGAGPARPPAPPRRRPAGHRRPAAGRGPGPAVPGCRRRAIRMRSGSRRRSAR